MADTAPVTSAPRRALKAAARWSDRVRPPAPGITVLIYHRVGAAVGGQMTLDPAVFRDQVAWLDAHTRLLSLDAAVAEISGRGPVEPGVVLTFDDGTADWVDVAAPILTDLGAPATFYLTTAYPDGELPLPDGEPSISWAGVAELASSDLFTVGSHTHTHRLLDRLDPDAIGAELDRSIELIAAHTGAAPAHFAYPKAVPPSRPAHDAVRRRFTSAALAGTHANRAGDDPMTLARSPIQAADTFDDFVRKVRGGMGLEDALRRRLNEIRYRRAAS